MANASPTFKYNNDTVTYPTATTESVLVIGTNEVEEDPVTIRVTFNRNLTWSERETFREWIASTPNREHTFNRADVVVVYDGRLEAWDESSRVLYKDVADFVAKQFVNVHPRAVKSIYPEVTV